MDMIDMIQCDAFARQTIRGQKFRCAEKMLGAGPVSMVACPPCLPTTYYLLPPSIRAWAIKSSLFCLFRVSTGMQRVSVDPLDPSNLNTCFSLSFFFQICKTLNNLMLWKGPHLAADLPPHKVLSRANLGGLGHLPTRHALFCFPSGSTGSFTLVARERDTHTPPFSSRQKKRLTQHSTMW